MTATYLSPHDHEDGRIKTDAPASAAGILVVDDDPVVVCLLQVCLPRLGFTVWIANSGQAGLSLYEEHCDQIDLVLLDVRMPVMDGPETLRELRRLDPDVKCCFMSGYTGLYTADALLQMGALALFAKPFDLDDLSQSLRRFVEPKPLRKTA